MWIRNVTAYKDSRCDIKAFIKLLKLFQDCSSLPLRTKINRTKFLFYSWTLWCSFPRILCGPGFMNASLGSYRLGTESAERHGFSSCLSLSANKSAPFIRLSVCLSVLLKTLLKVGRLEVAQTWQFKHLCNWVGECTKRLPMDGTCMYTATSRPTAEKSDFLIQDTPFSKSYQSQ
jgi:hypothetical protein